jgi:hypothetical protein
MAQQGFFFLEPVGLAEIISPERSEVRRLYLDCLSVLHDDVAAISLDPVWPRFSREEIGMMIEECLERLGDEPFGLRENVRTNRSRVDILNFKVGSLSAREKADSLGLPAIIDIFSEVEGFRNGLLWQYGVLRWSQRGRE